VAHGRRILITGVSQFWGAELAARLEKDPGVEQLVAIDSDGPRRELARTDVIRADLRHALLGKLIRGLGIDTVIHAGLIVDPRHAPARAIHEGNVIGTMNLMAACGGEDTPVRHLVVRSSTAIYGSEPDDPSFWSEAMARRAPARDPITRSIDEFEAFVRDYALRQPQVRVTTLRFANVLGIENDTPFAGLFELPVVPTVFGFDPRLQLIHHEDAVAALEHAVSADRAGIFNVAGDGIVILSQAVAMLGKINAPILPFLGGHLVVAALARLGIRGIPPHLLRLLQYGRVVDTTAMHDELGFHPAYTTIATVADYARRRRLRGIAAEEPVSTYEAELEALLRSKARNRAAERAAASRPRRRRAPTPARP
jgi:UDP-glucose 4-epimerase